VTANYGRDWVGETYWIW